MPVRMMLTPAAATAARPFPPPGLALSAGGGFERAIGKSLRPPVTSAPVAASIVTFATALSVSIGADRVIVRTDAAVSPALQRQFPRLAGVPPAPAASGARHLSRPPGGPRSRGRSTTPASMSPSGTTGPRLARLPAGPTASSRSKAACRGGDQPGVRGNIRIGHFGYGHVDARVKKGDRVKLANSSGGRPRIPGTCI